MEDIVISDVNNNNHGWQKVTYAKKRKNNNQKLTHTTVAGSAADDEKNGNGNGNVFRAIDQQSEDRHRRIVESRTLDADDDDDYENNKNRSKKKKNKKNKFGESDDSGSSDVDERENNNNVEDVKKEKKKKPKAEKKPKVSVSEAANKIDADNLSAFLVDVSTEYAEEEDIQLKRFADYFGRAFSDVSPAQFPWVKTFKESPVAKIVDIPLSHIPEAVYRTSADWLNHRSVPALSSFALLLIDSIVADLGNQVSSVKNAKKANLQPSSKSQVAIFVVLSIVLRRKPDVLVSLLPTLRENSKYQGQDKLPVLIWMITQACQGDLAVGLLAWAHNLLPMLNNKSTNNPLNRDLILQLVERILAAPKARTILVNGAVRKGERLIPPAELEILMRVTFPVSSARMKATERFEAVYPTLKEVALAGAPGSKAMRQVSQHIFGSAIGAAGEANAELAKEATSIVLWCLAQNDDVFKLWDKVYLDNLQASVAILKKLSVEIKEKQISQSTAEVLKQTMRSFQEKNEEALAEDSVAHEALLKDADKYAKTILGRLSRGHGCLKAFLFVGIAMAAGAAAMSSSADTFDWKRVSVMLSSFHSA